jgi:hypothetical protein
MRVHLNKTSWVWWHTPVIPATQKASKGKLYPELLAWDINGRAYLEKIKQKIECLSGKHKALSSNSSNAKKEKPRR